MPSYKEEKDFIEAVIGRSLLDEAIEWIGKNMVPEEVFPVHKLEAWSEENGYVKEGENDHN